ncbi:hypothetical protein JZ751_022775, partial [Albula glossodonta]
GPERGVISLDPLKPLFRELRVAPVTCEIRLRSYERLALIGPRSTPPPEYCGLESFGFILLVHVQSMGVIFITTSRRTLTHLVCDDGYSVVRLYFIWRRFVFFDKETVKDPADNGKNFVVPVGISACDSGRGHIVLGDILLCIFPIDISGSSC